MTLDEKIAQVRALISQRDDIDQQIAALLGGAAAQASVARKGKGKRGRPYGKHKTETEEIEAAASRTRLDPAIVQDVEDRLMAGETVAAIHEKVDVSAPTI